MPAIEANYDALPGPTHHYSGLAEGNLHAQRNAETSSRPREAVLQGLAKMKRLSDLGLVQGIIPPQHRPEVDAMRRLGFEGTDTQIIERAAKEDPRLLSACSESASMWAANAATVSPSADTADGRVHFTPANLLTNFHRSLEAATTSRLLRALFPDRSRFEHHDPLPGAPAFADEGAANHSRLCAGYGEPGVELFVFGRRGMRPGAGEATLREPTRYTARQTLESARALARMHRLRPDATVIWQQNPEAIDAGVFHNDVIAVANRDFMLHHELAYVQIDLFESQVREAYERVAPGKELRITRITRDDLPVEVAERTYLFNSQLLTLPGGQTMLFAPMACREDDTAHALLKHLASDAECPIDRVEYAEVSQSLKNGGGPACLRLRVVLTEAELAGAHGGAIMTAALYERLVAWANKHYREELSLDELADPALLEESKSALDELTSLLGLGPVYPFQLT